MKNPTSRSHPLHVPRPQLAAVSQAVAVTHLPGEDVGNRLDTPMWMPGKPGEIIVRILVPKIIQQQERVEVLGLSEAKGTAQSHTRSFDRGLGLINSLDGSDGHMRLLFLGLLPFSVSYSARRQRTTWAVHFPLGLRPLSSSAELPTAVTMVSSARTTLAP